MNKKKESIIFMNELFTGTQTSTSDVSHYIRTLVESGDKIFRQGHDLVRLTAAGDVIRVEGFFDLADQLTSESVELDATLSWLLAQSCGIQRLLRSRKSFSLQRSAMLT